MHGVGDDWLCPVNFTLVLSRLSCELLTNEITLLMKCVWAIWSWAPKLFKKIPALHRTIQLSSLLSNINSAAIWDSRLKMCSNSVFYGCHLVEISHTSTRWNLPCWDHDWLQLMTPQGPFHQMAFMYCIRWLLWIFLLLLQHLYLFWVYGPSKWGVRP